MKTALTQHSPRTDRKSDRGSPPRNYFILAARLLFALLALAICGGRAVAQTDHKPQAVRDVIGRSVPFIERSEADWIANKGCVSCHHTAFAVWSLDAAKHKGIHVDPDKLKQWTDWSADWRNLNAPAIRAKASRGDTVRGQCDTLVQLLLGRAILDQEVSQPQWVAEFTNDLRNAQQPDGSWSPGGQLPSQKRPKRETQEVSTMWALLALTAGDGQSDSLTARIKKAGDWLGETTSGKSTEWWATRSMLERKLGKAVKADHFRKELLQRQRADGGWGWLCDDESDALGTGIALYALGEDNLPRTDPAITKAGQFLARSQSNDGSWPVRGTKENKKNRVEPTATFWGTCWAVIGLCKTLDD